MVTRQRHEWTFTRELPFVPLHGSLGQHRHAEIPVDRARPKDANGFKPPRTFNLNGHIEELRW
jgi:hypothetical protein